MKRIAILMSLAMLALWVAGCASEDSPATDRVSTAVEEATLANTPCPPTAVMFRSDGGVQDYTIIQRAGAYHVFHIADPDLGWTTGLGAKDFGHATSPNLLEWTYLNRIDLRHEDWSGACIWAPHVLEKDGVYYMFFTGVEWDEAEGPAHNWQRIGLATSPDLSDWTLHNGTGLVLDGPWHDRNAWSAYGTPGEWNNDCRDPFVFDDGTGYVMLVSTHLYENGVEWPQMAIAVAKSPDLLNWTWSHYLPATVGDVAESANLVRIDGTYFLMWTTTQDGDIKVATATQIDGPYTVRPSEGLYGYANETLQTNDILVYGAIVDDYDSNGRDLRFRKIRLRAGDPVVEITDFTTCDF